MYVYTGDKELKRLVVCVSFNVDSESVCVYINDGENTQKSIKKVKSSK